MSAAHQASPEHEPHVRERHSLATPHLLDLVEALRKENDQLRTALVSRIVIEQAKGMLAERLQLHVDEAFERLRREARSRRMRLHELAAAVVARDEWTERLFRAREAGNTAPAPPAQTRAGSSSRAAQRSTASIHS